MRIEEDSIVYKVGLKLLGFFVTVLCKTLRIEKKNFSQLNDHLQSGKQCIVGFWHGTMLIPWFLLRNKTFTAIVSRSKDGELLTRVLSKWKYKVIRGSSHDGGKSAFDSILEFLGKGESLAITPDGPTGPPLKMKAGGVVASQRTGVPLFLIGVSCKNAIRLKSWDAFEIPKPFSRVSCIASDKILFDKDLSRDEISEKIIETESRLNLIKKEAEQSV